VCGSENWRRDEVGPTRSGDPAQAELVAVVAVGDDRRERARRRSGAPSKFEAAVAVASGPYY
jgi:hypothetical protein